MGSALVIGTVFGYVNSAQQLIGEHFGAGDMFPYMFGGTAATMALSSIVNSRIVERFGARRVSHTGLLIFIVVSALQVWVAHGPHSAQLEWFLPLMACNLALAGFPRVEFRLDRDAALCRDRRRGQLDAVLHADAAGGGDRDRDRAIL